MKLESLAFCSVFVFENIENIILMLFENCFCYLNLVFSTFSIFFRTKEKWEPNGVLYVFHKKKKHISKTLTKQAKPLASCSFLLSLFYVSPFHQEKSNHAHIHDVGSGFIIGPYCIDQKDREKIQQCMKYKRLWEATFQSKQPNSLCIYIYIKEAKRH